MRIKTVIIILFFSRDFVTKMLSRLFSIFLSYLFFFFEMETMVLTNVRYAFKACPVSDTLI